MLRDKMEEEMDFAKGIVEELSSRIFPLGINLSEIEQKAFCNLGSKNYVIGLLDGFRVKERLTILGSWNPYTFFEKEDDFFKKVISTTYCFGFENSCMLGYVKKINPSSRGFMPNENLFYIQDECGRKWENQQVVDYLEVLLFDHYFKAKKD